MVYYGTISKGCERCRQRKVKVSRFCTRSARVQWCNSIDSGYTVRPTDAKLPEVWKVWQRLSRLSQSPTFCFETNPSESSEIVERNTSSILPLHRPKQSVFLRSHRMNAWSQKALLRWFWCNCASLRMSLVPTSSSARTQSTSLRSPVTTTTGWRSRTWKMTMSFE